MDPIRQHPDSVLTHKALPQPSPHLSTAFSSLSPAALQGWEAITDAAIAALSRRRSHVVFLLWGKPAQTKEKLINQVGSRHSRTCPPEKAAMPGPKLVDLAAGQARHIGLRAPIRPVSPARLLRVSLPSTRPFDQAILTCCRSSTPCCSALARRCKHFSKANALLQKKGQRSINWQL